MQFRVLPVHRDEHLVAVALAGGDDPGLDVVEWRQVTPGHCRHVDVVQPPVLVPAGVLQVQQVPAVPGPGEHPDAAVLVVGDGLGGVPVDAPGTDGRDPDVKYPLARRDPGELAAVRGDVRADPLGITEKHVTRDEIGHVPMPTTPAGAGGPARPVRPKRTGRPGVEPGRQHDPGLTRRTSGRARGWCCGRCAFSPGTPRARWAPARARCRTCRTLPIPLAAGRGGNR